MASSLDARFQALMETLTPQDQARLRRELARTNDDFQIGRDNNRAMLLGQHSEHRPYPIRLPTPVTIERNELVDYVPVDVDE